MKKSAHWAPAPNLTILTVERDETNWAVSVSGGDHAICPVCRVRSHSRHSSYRRTLRDLPAQGTPVEVRAQMTRWRCRNDRCERRIFAERIPGLAAPFARRTTRLAGIVRLFGHSAGGRPSERLMARLGMLVGHCTILREVKRSAQTDANAALVRVAGIDDWAWKKGMNYGTVIVDLERRQVVDVLSRPFGRFHRRVAQKASGDRSDQPRPRRTLCRGRTRRSPASAAGCRPFPPAAELPGGGRKAADLSGRAGTEKQRRRSGKNPIPGEFPRARIGILHSERPVLRNLPGLLKSRFFMRLTKASPRSRAHWASGDGVLSAGRVLLSCPNATRQNRKHPRLPTSRALLSRRFTEEPHRCGSCSER